MAWYEGFSSLKGQITNFAKGVLNENEEYSSNEISSPSTSSNNDNVPQISNTNKEADDWNNAFSNHGEFIDPSTVPISPWSNEQTTVQNTTVTSASSKQKDDIEIPSILPRGLANFFTNQSITTGTGDQSADKYIQTDDNDLSDAYRRLQQQNSNLRTEIETLTRVVEDLQSQVAVSQDENANLSTGLEELDLQHQQAIEQVLVVKDETQKQYEILQTKYNDLEMNFEQKLKEKFNEKLKLMKDIGTDYECDQCDQVSVGTMVDDVEQESPEQLSSNNIDLIKELEDRDNELDLAVSENARLLDIIKDLEKELERYQETLPSIPENNEETEALELRVNGLENEISILHEVRTNLETEVSTSRTTIEDLTRRLQISDAMIRSNNSSPMDEEKIATTLREQELYELREHCEKVEANLRSLELQSSETLAKLRREIEEKDRRREELERDMERLQSEIQEERRHHLMNLEAESLQFKKKITQLQGQLQEMDVQVDRLQKEIEIKDKKMCAIVFETNSLKEEFEFYKNEMEIKYKILTEDYENLKVNRDFQNNEKNETELRLQLKEQELEIKARKDAEASLNEEIDRKTKHCEQLQNQVQQLQSNIDEIVTSNNKLQNDYEFEKELLLKKLDTLTTISNEYDVYKDLNKQKEIEFKNQLQLLEEELNKSKMKIKEIETNKADTCDQIKADLEEKLNVKNLEIKEIHEINENLQIKLSNLETNFKSNDNEMEKLQKLNHELKEKYENLIKVTEIAVEQAEQKSLKSIEDVDALKLNLEESALKLKQAEDLRAHSMQMCESIKVEFLNKLEMERKEHEEQMENLVKEKSSLNIQNQELLEKCNKLEMENVELQKNFQTKSAECRNHQNEIERLNFILVDEKTKYEKILEEKQKEITAEKLNVANYEEKLAQIEEMWKNKNKETSILTQELDSVKNQLEYASQLLSVVDRQEAEGQPSGDVALNSVQNQTCQNGCKQTQEELNRVTGALLREQTENKLLKNQVEDLTESVNKLSNQLNRLKTHLISVEERYTMELQTAEIKLSEMQTKLIQADDRAKNSSTAYTSANIRANQQVESLNQQLRLLTEHKEKLEAELSKAEDSVQRQNAAVTNLQAVLHQFQRDKQKDIDFETERLRQTLNAQCKKNDELLNEIKHLQDQLIETKKGLAAANRLTEQLDQKTEMISSYKQQVDELMLKLKNEETKVLAAYSNVEGKIDRNLMKNLMVGYVSSPNNSKLQVLKVLAQVLDLNKEERQKVGLEPNPSAQQQSLSEAFIRFLESESQPKPQIFLPLSQPTSTPPSRKTSQTGSILLTETVPNLPNFAVGRNTGSILKDVLKDRNN